MRIAGFQNADEGLGGTKARPDLTKAFSKKGWRELGPKALRVTVIGSGSVGLVAAASLALAGAHVTLTVRAGSVAALRENPLVLRGMLGDHRCAAG